MSFVQSLSGLYGASAGLDVIGNNLANAGTIGYKNSRAEFSDIFSSYLRNEAGQGTFAPTAVEQFTQGALSSSNNPLDFSINGNGMFQLSKNAAGTDQISYTRNGEFHFLPVAGSTTGEKNIVNANGGYLTGWAATAGANGTTSIVTTGAPSVLTIADAMAGKVSATSTFRFNLDDAAVVPANQTFNPNDPNTFNWASTQEIFSGVENDSKVHTLQLYFAKTATPDTWNVYSSVDGTVSATAQPVSFTPGGLLATGGAFSVAGSVNAEVQTTDATTGAVTTTTTVVPLTLAVDMSTTTQFASPFDMAKSEQDGYKSGYLGSTSLTTDGTIVGRYSNDRTQNIGKVALATFVNPNGLQSIGGNLWLETTSSGKATISAAADKLNGTGVLSSNSLEQANVDLAAELVNMITMQRNYQANAQSIKTQDEVLRTLSGLR